MKASEFLKFISDVKKFVDFSSEERKEDSNCDWLFKQMDARLINLSTELDLVQSWFDGKKIRLEKLYRATEDGFNGTAYHAKCNNIENILNVVESEHGKRFGGYSSVKFDSTNKWYVDGKAFIFSLSEKKKFEIIDPNSE